MPIHAVIGRDGVHHRTVVAEQRELIGPTDQKGSGIDRGEEQHAIVGDIGPGADDAELQTGMIVYESVFPHIGKTNDRVRADFGTLFNNAAFNDGRWMNFGIRVNARNGPQNTEFVNGTRFQHGAHL